MIRYLWPLLLALALPFAGAQAREAKRDYMITSFRDVAVDGPITVVIKAGTAPSVVAHGDAEMIERLLVRKNGDRLRLSLSRTGTEIDPARQRPGRLRVEVSSWAIERLSLNGPADVTADALSGQQVDLKIAGAGRLAVGKVAADILRVAMTGNGSLTLSGGQVDQARIELNGAPEIAASAVESRRLDLSLIGPATVAIGARDSARISASGAGKVDIGGRPSCTIQSAGMAEIACGY